MGCSCKGEWVSNALVQQSFEALHRRYHYALSKGEHPLKRVKKQTASSLSRKNGVVSHLNNIDDFCQY
jgi:hypothetical protein